VSLDEYINNFIVPVFSGSVNSSIAWHIRKLNGDIVLCSQWYAKRVGYESYEDLVGKNIRDVANGILGSYNENILPKINAAMALGHVVDLIDDYAAGADGVSMISLQPLFMPDHTVAAIYGVRRPVQLPSWRELILSHIHKTDSGMAIVGSSLLFDLSYNAELILFFLLNGFVQEEIARFLNVSRGYVAKLIASELCPKFDIEGCSTKLLVEKALDLGLASYVPRAVISDFISPCVDISGKLAAADE
jgi:hypothetical protein